MLVFLLASITEVPFRSFEYCLMTAGLCIESLLAFISFHLYSDGKRQVSITNSIKTEYPFIKGVNENVECTLWKTQNFALYMVVRCESRGKKKMPCFQINNFEPTFVCLNLLVLNI
jgi:hypothetical protein